MIGRLWNGLKERSMEDKINIILVGDHGTVLAYSITRNDFCKFCHFIMGFQVSIL